MAQYGQWLDPPPPRVVQCRFDALQAVSANPGGGATFPPGDPPDVWPQTGTPTLATDVTTAGGGSALVDATSTEAWNASTIVTVISNVDPTGSVEYQPAPVDPAAIGFEIEDPEDPVALDLVLRGTATRTTMTDAPGPWPGDIRVAPSAELVSTGWAGATFPFGSVASWQHVADVDDYTVPLETTLTGMPDRTALVPYGVADELFPSGTGNGIRIQVQGVTVHVQVSHLTRYRWVYPTGGFWRMRQRQSRTGTDSWPLRQRQNGGHTGSWPLRQRQGGA